MYIYQLRFTDTIRTETVTEPVMDEQGEVIDHVTKDVEITTSARDNWKVLYRKLKHSAIITIVELGTLADDEGYHVDLKTSELLPIPNGFITAPNNPKHGERWKAGCVVVQPEPEAPNDTWLKVEIREYLTNNGIEWKQSWTKAHLLDACQ
jgi:hypothetical protein